VPLQGGREDAFKAYVTGITRKESNDIKRSLQKRILGSKDFQGRMKRLMEKTANTSHPTKMVARMRKMYVSIGAVMMLVVALAAGFFTKEHSELVTQYDETLKVYARTLKMLEAERAMAARANQSVEDYAWKIRLAEDSMKALEAEKELAIAAAKELEGRSWTIALKQIGGPKDAFASNDTLTFSNYTVASEHLGGRGFGATRYSKKESAAGKVVWETIQRNGRGDTASWRGEWDGSTMKGVLSRRDTNGTFRDYSFTTTGTAKVIEP
jgi:hypothetical protein